MRTVSNTNTAQPIDLTYVGMNTDEIREKLAKASLLMLTTDLTHKKPKDFTMLLLYE